MEETIKLFIKQKQKNNKQKCKVKSISVFLDLVIDDGYIDLQIKYFWEQELCGCLAARGAEAGGR